jgi:hypothetical protein
VGEVGGEDVEDARVVGADDDLAERVEMLV